MNFDTSLESISPVNSTVLTLNASGGIMLASGTTAQRPVSPTAGTIRYNTDNAVLEYFAASTWNLFQDDIDSVRVASTAGVTISAPGATMDGVTLVAGDRVLLKDQASLPDNGIYVWNGAAVAMTRAVDMSTSWNASVPGRIVFVNEGNTSQFFNYRFVTAFNGTYGTTDITVTSGWWQAGRISFGDSVTPALAASGGFGQRSLTLIDTNAAMRAWRYLDSTSGNSCGLEMIVGNNPDLANAANLWWDVSTNTDTQEGVRIARRTGGTIQPKLMLDLNGRLTIGTTVLAGGATGAAFASSTLTDLYVNGTAGVVMSNGTTAQRPATPTVGTIRYNSSTGTTETYEASGTSWVGNVGTVDRSVVAVSNTTIAANATTFTSMIAYTVPANMLGTTRLLRIRASGTFVNSSAKLLTFTITYGGSPLWTDTSASVAAGTIGWNIDVILNSAASVTAQRLSGIIQLGINGAPTAGTTGDLTTDEITANTILSGSTTINSAVAQAFGFGCAITAGTAGGTVNFTKHFHIIELI